MGLEFRRVLFRSIVLALQSKDIELMQLFSKAAEVRHSTIGNGVHTRGLIEVSNICRKGCLYCGIRHNNTEVDRYMHTLDYTVNAERLVHTT